jgi:hypothetical protein
MIQEFVDRYIAKQDEFRAKMAKLIDKENYSFPGYGGLVRAVVELIGDGDYSEPDPERIHQIDDGDYQGTLVFVIAAKGYQPYTYWVIKVGYGSCSGCDALQAIQYDTPIDQQLADLYTLGLHMVQGMVEV